MRKGPSRPRIELPKGAKEAIIRAYNQGVPVWKLAEKYHVAYGTMWHRLHDWGVKVRRAGPIPTSDRHRYARFAKDVRRDILRLEKEVADRQAEVIKREAELKETQEDEPKKASVVVAKLKQADVELRTFEAELETLKGVAHD
jgi:hypothetical protein